METNAGGLRRRITLIVIAGISIMLLSFGVAGYFIIQKNIEESISKRLTLSRLLRNNIDNILKDNINRLYDISLSGAVDLNDGIFDPEREALKAAYRYSLFGDGVFLLDRGGNIVLDYPERIRDTPLNVLSIEPVRRMLAEGRPVVSNVYTGENGRKNLYVLAPLKDRDGAVVGAIGGQIDPTNPTLIQKFGLSDVGRHMYVDIVDSNGVIISSSDPGRILTQCNRDKFFTRVIAAKKERVATCHICHVTDNAADKHKTILAFVPLETAPWGIAIQEPREEVFASADTLRRTFAALGVVFIGTAFILTIGMNRGIVVPLKELIRGADRIARGDLSRPVTPQGSDEIGWLSHSFETMRRKLLASLDDIRRHTTELEERVQERTKEIEQARRTAEKLLKKIITSEEDERKRISRELHDTTLQDLSAVIMQIDMCKLHPDEITTEKIEAIRSIVLNSWEGVISTIQNLRPSLLDDLGLSSAIKSLLDMHLGERGINYFMNADGLDETRFRPEVEITLFRIAQEAIANIARHAQAENVFVLFKMNSDAVILDIEDDGIGFDMDSIFNPPSLDVKLSRGLGLMGMRERVNLINGQMEVCSLQGLGTQINVRLPVAPAEVRHA